MASRSEARMRKAFKFTDDNDSDDMPEALDEEGMCLLEPWLLNVLRSKLRHEFRSIFRSEPHLTTLPEQEHLIADFRASEAKMNLIYTRAFTIFPIALIFAYLPPLYSGLGGRGWRIPLLAITSLLCTAWTMHFVPAGQTGIPPLDKFIHNMRDTASEKAKGKRPELSTAGLRMGAHGGIGGQGPIMQFLPIMNAALAFLILLMGRFAAGSTKGEREDGISKLVVSGLPMLALGMMVGAKIMLGGVGVDELEGLRYGYKGA